MSFAKRVQREGRKRSVHQNREAVALGSGSRETPTTTGFCGQQRVRTSDLLLVREAL
jgi:hypothetical protein